MDNYKTRHNYLVATSEGYRNFIKKFRSDEIGYLEGFADFIVMPGLMEDFSKCDEQYFLDEWNHWNS